MRTEFATAFISSFSFYLGGTMIFFILYPINAALVAMQIGN